MVQANGVNLRHTKVLMADKANASIYKTIRKKAIKATDNSSVDTNTLSLWEKIFGKAEEKEKDIDKLGYLKK